ncbi:hypothetical protein NIES4101_73340 [Calothrix sp. NIES-4101]|nr:hypothetical protein NIES4101_73340 [Calothrix sp. NIES-4101]
MSQDLVIIAQNNPHKFRSQKLNKDIVFIGAVCGGSIAVSREVSPMFSFFMSATLPVLSERSKMLSLPK